MDHGRRAHLLRAREELRRVGPLPRARRGDGRLRDRLPDPDRARVGAVRRRAAGLRGGEGDQRGRDVARRGARVLPRAPRALVRLRAGGSCALRRDPVDGLHGDADDGERVLPALPDRRADARALAGAADRAPDGAAPRHLPRRVSHAPAGARVAPGARHGALPRRRQAGDPPLRAALRRRRGGSDRRRRRPGRARRVAARHLRRLRGCGEDALLRARGGEVVPLPRRRARSLARRASVRRAAPARPDVAAACRARSDLRGGGRLALVLARARGGDLRVRADVPDRGAEHVLRRAALPHRAARLDRARRAATAAGDARSPRLSPPGSRSSCRTRTSSG